MSQHEERIRSQADRVEEDFAPRDARKPEDFSLPLLSPRRKANQINLAFLLVFALGIYGVTYSYRAFDSISEAAQADIAETARSEGVAAPPADEALPLTSQAVSASRTRFLVITIGSLALLLFLMHRLVTVGIRSIGLEIWIRRMGAGDLDFKVEMKEDDEITRLAEALEKLRLRSIEALKLDLVRRLSEGLMEKNAELERVLAELKEMQGQIIVRRKLVELGELTAGVAHEIRNPLNFMNNFAHSSRELAGELEELLEEKARRPGDEDPRELVEIARDLASNMARIASHGARVDRIVRDMIALGSGGGLAERVEIGKLLADSAKLALHSAHAGDPDFRCDFLTDFDPAAEELSVIPEDMGRVFRNVLGNACYATAEKLRSSGDDCDAYTPTVRLSTKRRGDTVEIRIRDNGGGIPQDVIDKIFNPFFTTKPSDHATGLGLSLSHDIVRQHGGSITPVSRVGEFTEMIISLPVEGSLGAASA